MILILQSTSKRFSSKSSSVNHTITFPTRLKQINKRFAEVGLLPKVNVKVLFCILVWFLNGQHEFRQSVSLFDFNYLFSGLAEDLNSVVTLLSSCRESSLTTAVQWDASVVFRAHLHEDTRNNSTVMLLCSRGEPWVGQHHTIQSKAASQFTYIQDHMCESPPDPQIKQRK